MEAASSGDAMPELPGISDPIAYRIVASSSDLAIIVDPEGIVVDYWLGESIDAHPGWRKLVGQRWSDTVLDDSQRKVEKLLRDAASEHSTRSREINQAIEGLGEIPLRFSGALGEDGHVVALGQDMRPVAEMQQRLISAQQAMDLEYRRLRQADTRYRVLFHVSSEGVLVARGQDRVVVEANPAAAAILGEAADALTGKPLHELFSPDKRDDVSSLVGAAEAGADAQVELLPKADESQVLTAAASTFRQSGQVFLLVRFWRGSPEAPTSARDSRMLKALEAIPDGFVVTGEDRRILSANSGFCEIVQRTDEAQVVGRRLDRWLGRPGVDLNIILANLREYGVVRNFSTIVRGDFDAEQEAMVTAVSALDGKVPCFGFTIRPVTSRLEDAPTTTLLPRSVDQIRSLVGRVPLKEIVRESADLIERLCISAALDVSSNNRAAAAQLLGLSRQSLYSKLRRHGLDDPQPS